MTTEEKQAALDHHRLSLLYACRGLEHAGMTHTDGNGMRLHYEVKFWTEESRIRNLMVKGHATPEFNASLASLIRLTHNTFEQNMKIVAERGTPEEGAVRKWRKERKNLVIDMLKTHFNLYLYL